MVVDHLHKEKILHQRHVELVEPDRIQMPQEAIGYSGGGGAGGDNQIFLMVQQVLEHQMVKEVQEMLLMLP